ncbi:MAG TPA: septum formation initiator family protein [Acidimicrobiia bacterium]
MTLIRRPGAAAVTFLFLLMGAAFLTQVVPYRQIIETQRQVATARAELEALEDHNAELQADVSALQTDAEIERLAREKLGYVRPGEKAYVVLDPPGTKDPEPADPAPAPLEKTWVEKVWEFITGADLSS